MTLFRQFFLLNVGVIFTLLAGSFVLSIVNSRHLLEEQMHVHAQDAATSLAISITESVVNEDRARLEALFSAVSDLGYYKSIFFKDTEGEIVIERNFLTGTEGVPDLFVRLMNMPEIDGRAEVTSNWLQLGEVVVISHPGQVYRHLWQRTRTQLIWYGGALIALSILGGIVIRLFLSPVKALEQQANAIFEQRFDVQVQEPRTRELRHVVRAMNRMSGRLGEIFSDQMALIKQMQGRLYRDPVTGLSTREHFDARLKTLIAADSEGSSGGLLALISIARFERVNSLVGRVEGNNLLRRIGERLVEQTATYQEALVSRRQGPQFTIFIPGIETEQVSELAEALFASLTAVEWGHHDSEPLCLFMAVVHKEHIDSGAEILGEADLALNHISGGTESRWIDSADLADNTEVPVLVHTIEDWRKLLSRALQDNSLRILSQQMFSSPGNKVIGHELYTQIIDGENIIAAGVAVPMLQRFGLAEHFDRAVLTTIAETGAWQSLDGKLGVNLCVQSLRSASFMHWLRDFLQREKKLAKRIVIELPEHALRVCQDEVRELDGILLSRGAKMGLDHFGLESSSFAYLGNLPLDYLKIHQSFIRGVDRSPEAQFYVQSLAQIAHSRDISLYVEGVETEHEWATLKSLGVNGGQGYGLADPMPLTG